MLDRVDMRGDGAGHALGRDRVDRDDPAGIMRGGSGGGELGRVQGRPAALAALIVIIGIELHDVGAGRDLIAHGADDIVDPAHLLRALRHFQPRLESLGAVGTLGDDRAGRRQDAWARHDILRDRIAQADIGIACALGAEIAFGGEAGEQGRLRLGDRARGAQREAFVEHLIVPARLVIGVEEEVAVAFDQAGYQRIAGQVDHLCVGRDGEVGPGGDDPVAFDQYLPADVDRLPVEDAIGLEQGGGGGGERRGREHQRTDQWQYPHPGPRLPN